MEGDLYPQKEVEEKENRGEGKQDQRTLEMSGCGKRIRPSPSSLCLCDFHSRNDPEPEKGREVPLVEGLWKA